MIRKNPHIPPETYPSSVMKRLDEIIPGAKDCVKIKLMNSSIKSWQVTNDPPRPT